MSAVLYEKANRGSVALITLNRPRFLNAYDVTMRDALFAALHAVRDDPEVRVLILRGNGRAFCTGGDLREFGTAPSPVRAREVRWQRDVWGTLWGLPQFTIAAVHGLAVGGGFEMAMLCDQCLASHDAVFALPETGLGMIPGVGGTQTAPRLLGMGRGLDLVLNGRSLDARTARELGLVARTVAADRLQSEALRLARRVARLPTRLVAAVKQSVNTGLELPLSQGLELEQRLNRGLYAPLSTPPA